MATKTETNGRAVVAPRMKRSELVPSPAFKITGTLAWLPVDTLTVDPTYQRNVTAGHVQRIATNFDPDIFGTLTVSERADGTRAVVDGQHRVEALRLMGWDTERAPCLVYHGLTVQQEAKMFVDTQVTRLYMTPAMRFKAALAAGDPQTVAIYDAVARYGYEVNLTTGSAPDPKNIDAVGALIWIPRQYGMDQLHATLETMQNAWGHEYKIMGTVIRGLTLFMSRYAGHFEPPRLIQILRERSPILIDNEAIDITRAFRGARDEAVGVVILRAFNTKLSSNRLPSWENAPNRKTRSRVSYHTVSDTAAAPVDPMEALRARRAAAPGTQRPEGTRPDPDQPVAEPSVAEPLHAD